MNEKIAVLAKISEKQDQRYELPNHRKEFHDELRYLLFVTLCRDKVIRFLLSITAFGIFIISVFIYQDILKQIFDGWIVLIGAAGLSVFGWWVGQEWKDIAYIEQYKSRLITNEIEWLLEQQLRAGEPDRKNR